jgi:hypothetical protein
MTGYCEINDLYYQCGDYLEDCDEYFTKILKNVNEQKEYLSELFKKIDIDKKNEDTESLRKDLIEIKCFVVSLRTNPKVFRFEA